MNQNSRPPSLDGGIKPLVSVGRDLTVSERKLFDDLHVHQIELEMQNQELSRAKADLEHSRARYLDLFDFAPVAYFAVKSNRGTIESLNLAAGELLKTDRGRATGTILVNYFEPASQAL